MGFPYITLMPWEVLEQILQQLSPRDVAHLMQTNKRLLARFRKNDIWSFLLMRDVRKYSKGSVVPFEIPNARRAYRRVAPSAERSARRDWYEKAQKTRELVVQRRKRRMTRKERLREERKKQPLLRLHCRECGTILATTDGPAYKWMKKSSSRFWTVVKCAEDVKRGKVTPFCVPCADAKLSAQSERVAERFYARKMRSKEMVELLVKRNRKRSVIRGGAALAELGIQLTVPSHRIKCG